MKSALYALAPDAAKNTYQRLKKMVGADVHAHVDRIALRHVARYLFANEVLAGRDVLDVACGSGYGALVLNKAFSYRGLDLDIRAVQEAKREFPEFNYDRGSIYDLPLPDASVSGATSFETLEHVDQPERAMRELARVLKPGGVLVGSIPINHPDLIHHFKPYTAAEAFAIFDSAGLTFTGLHVQHEMTFRQIAAGDVNDVPGGTLLAVMTRSG